MQKLNTAEFFHPLAREEVHREDTAAIHYVNVLL